MGRNTIIQIVLEFQRFKSIKACRPKARQTKVNENSSANSLKLSLQKIITTAEYLQKTTPYTLFPTP
ncbi:MAG: hypothetical protein LBP59_04320 [Planctomycetaceae bacterium]|nr:hypothetical protein [Planctomycetaceae bacterium]